MPKTSQIDRRRFSKRTSLTLSTYNALVAAYPKQNFDISMGYALNELIFDHPLLKKTNQPILYWL